VEFAEGDDATKFTLHTLGNGHDELMRLARHVRAAEVRLSVASVLHDMRVAGEELPDAS
jgi:hypothetical protein